MSLSKQLAAQFAKNINGNKKQTKTDTITYGKLEYQDDDGTYRVQLDGAPDGSSLPISKYTSEVNPSERVIVMIKNRSAVIMGNITSPSTTVSSVNKKLAQKVDRDEVSNFSAAIDTLTSQIDNLNNNKADKTLVDSKADKTLVDNIFDQTDYLTGQVANLNNNKADKASLDTINNRLDEIVRDHNVDYEDLDGRIDDQSNHFTQQISNVNSSINNLSNNVQTNMQDIEDLQQQINDNAQDIGGLQQELNERIGEVVNDHNEDFGNLSNSIQVHSQDIEDLQQQINDNAQDIGELQQTVNGMNGGSSLFKCLARHTLSSNGYVDISSYMSQYNELMIIIRTVVGSATIIGVSSSTSGSGNFLASTSVTGTLYTKITLNKTDEGSYACNVGTSFGWATSSAYKYIRNYSAGSGSVTMTVVIHGR